MSFGQHITVALLAAILAIGGCLACATSRAKGDVLTPAMQRQWTEDLRPDAESGAAMQADPQAALVHVVEFDLAIGDGTLDAADVQLFRASVRPLCLDHYQTKPPDEERALIHFLDVFDHALNQFTIGAVATVRRLAA